MALLSFLVFAVVQVKATEISGFSGGLFEESEVKAMIQKDIESQRGIASVTKTKVVKKLKSPKKGKHAIGSVDPDMTVGLVAVKKKTNKSAEKIEEEDFGRLDRELEILK